MSTGIDILVVLLLMVGGLAGPLGPWRRPPWAV